MPPARIMAQNGVVECNAPIRDRDVGRKTRLECKRRLVWAGMPGTKWAWEKQTGHGFAAFSSPP